jgi:hypothetical protein
MDYLSSASFRSSIPEKVEQRIKIDQSFRSTGRTIQMSAARLFH